MRVGVCDYPSSYQFPPTGYGGIERWLWATAIGARRAGADVHLIGPQWAPQLARDWHLLPVRLEAEAVGASLDHLRAQHYDLLIVGHEYPSLARWVQTSSQLDCDVATFQHSSTFQHAAGAFASSRTRLYCYSPEMATLYSGHAPRLDLAVHLDLLEDSLEAVEGRDLLWLGRLDSEKAPHIAAMAAAILKRRIRIAGPVFDEAYIKRHADSFNNQYVELVGEASGRSKAALFANAGVFVYTCERHYVEAGVATLGEALRAGTPVAALAWKPGTCADAALCPETGIVARVERSEDDRAAALALAEAIQNASLLGASDVQAVGQSRFDPRRHFEALARPR